jgi:hypothetical protein
MPVRDEGDSDMSIHLNIDQIPNVRRFENFPKEQMVATSMELTHAVYPHDETYGQYCTIEEYIDCPPETVFDYLATPYTLAEWTYSMRNFGEPDENGRQPRRDDRRLPLRVGPARGPLDDLPHAGGAGAAGAR